MITVIVYVLHTVVYRLKKCSILFCSWNFDWQEMKDQGVMEDRLVLLKGVSGAFGPDVLTALMGAGKETFARISGYCEQNDIHSPQVTVYKSVLYSAWLCLPAEVDFKTRKVVTYCSSHLMILPFTYFF